jgi:hypothetical protein
MIPYSVGDMVVCIYDGEWNNNIGIIPISLPTKGCIYTVRSMFDIPCGAVYIRLVEIINPLPSCGGFGEAGFIAHYFRPVKKTSIESLERIARTLYVPQKQQEKV